jgi:hypothetical protein
MFLSLRLSQKVSLGKRFHQGWSKRLVFRFVLLSFIHQNLAFATQSIIELDFKYSQTPQRLHVIPRLSNVGDVSHVEIDTEKRQVNVYRVDATQLTEEENVPSLVHPDAIKKHPVIVPAYDVQNLPWELEPEKLTLFILNHTAWLNPLEGDGYKLEFRGGLLGGGGVQSTGGGGGGQSTGGGGGGKKELVVDVYAKGVDCGNRNDWPKGTMGDKYCRNNGNGSGGSGIIVFNKPYVPPVDKEWQNHCEKIRKNPFGKQKIAYRSSQKDDKSDLEQINVSPKIRQALGKEVYGAIRPLIDGFHKGEVQDIVRKIPDLAMEALSNYQGGALSQKTIDEIVRNIGLYIDPRIKQTGSFRILNPADYYRILDQDRRWMGKEIDKVSRKAVSCAYEGLKKQYADELEKIEKRQKIEEEEREKARQYERDSSLAGSSLFKNVPPQYQVTPEYFEQSASDAGMMPSHALHIILNPTSENFYDRTVLTSRQKWLGGAKNTIAFVFEDLTNEQAYKYLSQGYHKGDFPTLSDRLVSQNGATLFENVKPEDFLKQAEKAKMTSIQALSILMNPTSENFYDRIILTSRQNWLGGAENTTAFGFEDLTNEQAYKYISQGYKPWDFPTLSNRLVSQRGATLFENVTPDYFVKQAEKTGMTPMQSLAILMNPTLENAYERVLLASRQNYLGGTHDLFVFRDIGVTVGEAYDHLLTHIKNKESFSQLVDDSTNKAIKEGFIQFCRERYQDRYGSFYGDYEKVKYLQYLINTNTWDAVYDYANKEKFSKEDVQYVDSRKKENITFDGYMKEIIDSDIAKDILMHLPFPSEVLESLAETFIPGRDLSTLQKDLDHLKEHIVDGILSYGEIWREGGEDLAYLLNDHPVLKKVLGDTGQTAGIIFGVGMVVPKGLKANPHKPRVFANKMPPVLRQQPDFKWVVKEAKNADKVGRHKKYGNIYKDPNQKAGNKEIFWSKDIGGKNAHSGEHIKLFEENGQTFDWIADVDMTGKVIPKHKGAAGQKLFKKDIIWK